MVKAEIHVIDIFTWIFAISATYKILRNPSSLKKFNKVTVFFSVEILLWFKLIIASKLQTILNGHFYC